MKQTKRLSEIIMEEAEKFDGPAKISHHTPKLELILSCHNWRGGVNNMYVATVVNESLQPVVVFRSWKSMANAKKRANAYLYKVRMTPVRVNSNIPH